MIKTVTEGGVKATLLTHSVYKGGPPIASWEVEFPRFILSEYNTHRQHSKNAASSRAIPILTQLKQIMAEPAMPSFFGKNQSGMSAKEEIEDVEEAKRIILWMRDCCEMGVNRLHGLGLHKQTANRYIEPWQTVKGVITATEFENFFYLRDHEAAQPEIAILARCMRECLEHSTPTELKDGEWHLPYIDSELDIDGVQRHYFCSEENLSLEDAIKISASMCAQVSYRKADESLEKAMKIYDMLVNMKPVHASPFEHQATPMSIPKQKYGHWGQEGTTHLDADSSFWSGNLKGWVQNRQLIKGHVYKSEAK